MNESFSLLMYYVLPLAITGLLVKYVFKVDLTFLWPSAILLTLFMLVMGLANFTSKEFETQLFTVFWVVYAMVLVAGILLMAKQEVVWKHFFISLPFQLYYWVTLFYYGGLMLSHKLDV